MVKQDITLQYIRMDADLQLVKITNLLPKINVLTH